jgi:hypothetical protein
MQLLRIYLQWLAVVQVAQAGVPRVPAAAVRAGSCGTCGGQIGTGAGLLRVLTFPLPIIPSSSAHTSSFFIIHHPRRVQ